MNLTKSFSLALALTPFFWTASTMTAKAEPPTPGESTTEASVLSESSNVEEETLAQGRRRRSVSRQPFNPNYLGIGANIGFDGETALGDTEFAVNGRIKLTPNLSFRPAAVIGENAAFLVPVTYDFAPKNISVAQRSLPPLIPYIGGGAFFTTNDDSEDDLGALVTAGLDVPLSRQFTANAGLNVGFINDDTEWGLLLGVGYNIPRN
ncbi:UNVERIFIED_CONTAM: hypothetical protein BEN50_06020 [Euhalothece sp. KZN 001]